MTNIIQERATYYKKLDESQKTKHHVLYIMPDYDCLLWENGTVLCGKDADGFDFEGSGFLKYVTFEKDKTIDEWLSRFENCCLMPCEAGEITREELICQFKWESFHLQGLQIALKIANQLPPECELWYVTPYEDASGILPEEILIKKAV